MHETNVIRKSWSSESLKVALVYPNQYSAMAGLTVQTMYHLFNQFSNVICERFFMPSRELSSLYPSLPEDYHRSPQKWQGKDVPALKSLENGMTLDKFDIIAFTICYEIDYANLLWILDNSKIPFNSKDRQNIKHNEEDVGIVGSSSPIILAGGVAIRSNPLPILPYCDAFFIGEFEPVVDNFIQTWFKCYNNSENISQSNINSEFLLKIDKLPGFLIPNRPQGLHQKIPKRVFIEKLDEALHPIQQIIPIYEPHEDSSLPFKEAFFVEVNRGCPHNCRFCLTGAQVKPFRNRSFDELTRIINQGIEHSSPSRVVLIGSSVTDHPRFLDLCQYLVFRNISFSIPSIRIDGTSPAMIALLKQSGMNTITFAPEAGSDRLRRKIGKRILNETILTESKKLLEAEFSSLKMYFLYGVPEETEEDIDAIIQLLESIVVHCKGHQKLKVSLNPCIPKAHTPYETHFQLLMEEKFATLRMRYQRISQSLKSYPNIELETLSLEEAYLQMLFSLGDISFAPIVKDFYESGLKIKKYVKSIQKSKNIYTDQINEYFYELNSKDFGDHAWNLIDQGVSPEILKRSLQRSQNS